MKSWLTFLLLLTCFNGPSPTPADEPCQSCPSAATTLDSIGLRAQAVGIVDGDTFDLLPLAPAPAEPIRIRLEGIDAPEKASPTAKPPNSTSAN